MSPSPHQPSPEDSKIIDSPSTNQPQDSHNNSQNDDNDPDIIDAQPLPEDHPEHRGHSPHSQHPHHQGQPRPRPVIINASGCLSLLLAQLGLAILTGILACLLGFFLARVTPLNFLFAAIISWFALRLLARALGQSNSKKNKP